MRMGAAGARVVVEDFLDGEEASFIVMADGAHALPLASSQDHKRLRDGDVGPNTGGMGAYSPAPVVTPTVHARIMRDIILPTIAGMAAEGVPYTGFLYAGRDDRRDRHAARARIQLSPRRSRDAADHGAASLGPRRARRARDQRHARSGRGRMGPARGAHRRAGGRRLSGRPAARRCHRGPGPRNAAKPSRRDDLSRRHDARARRRRRERRPRALRHRARRHAAPGAARRVWRDRRHRASTACSTAPTSGTARSRGARRRHDGIAAGTRRAGPARRCATT